MSIKTLSGGQGQETKFDQKNYYKRKWNWLLTYINDSLFMKTTKVIKILSCTVSSSSNWRTISACQKNKTTTKTTK